MVVELNAINNDMVHTIVSACGLSAQPRAKPQAGTKARVGGLGRFPDGQRQLYVPECVSNCLSKSNRR